MSDIIDLWNDLEDIEDLIKKTNQKGEMNDLLIERDRVINKIKKQYPELKLD